MLNTDPDPDPIGSRVLMTKSLKKFTAEKKNYIFFFDQKLKFTLYLSLGLHLKDVQVTEEAFSPQKRTSSTSKHEISLFFLLFGSFLLSWMRIRIH
jgi:hypothetical protein